MLHCNSKYDGKGSIKRDTTYFPQILHPLKKLMTHELLTSTNYHYLTQTFSELKNIMIDIDLSTLINNSDDDSGAYYHTSEQSNVVKNQNV